MKKIKLLLLFVLISVSGWAQQFEHHVLDDRREAGTVLLRTQIITPLQQTAKGLGLKFASPVPFNSFALAWQTANLNLIPSSFSIHYRVHRPGKGWREWSTEEGAYNPKENALGGLYTSDLLFGIDEGQHDSLEFYLEMPSGHSLQQVQLVLQDMSGHASSIPNEPNIEKTNAVACPAQPTTIPRSSWCGSFTACHTPTYTATYITPSHTVVHHGASPDTYTDGYAVVRSYWNYHVNTLGWSDIGYNYLFDKFSNVFIGRHNPNFPSQDVRAAHAGSSNGSSIGLNFLGNADIAGNVPQATLTIATEFMAWWYNLRGLNPTTSANILNQAGTMTIYLPRICGHKDLNATACPGVTLYNYLPTFRSAAQQIITNCSAVAAPTVSSSPGCVTGSVTLTVTVSASQTFQLLNSTGTTVLQTWTGTAASYTFTGLASGTYSAKVIRNTVSSPLSSTSTLTNSSNSVGGSIMGTAGSICLGSSTSTMTVSGHTGTILSWEKRVNSGTWSSITNTAATYSETPTTSGTWEYRTVVKNGSCAQVYSASFTKTVQASSVGGTVSGTSNSICLGSTTGTMTLTGQTGTVVRWEKRLGTATWANITNTTATYSETVSSIGSWEYRALVQNGACSSVYSRSYIITVSPATIAGTLSGTTGTVCLGSATGTMTVSGHNGSILRWEKRLGTGTWTSIANTTVSYTETPASAGTWEYRAVIQSGSCAIGYTNSFSKTIQATSLGGSVSGTMTSLCQNQSTGTLSLVGYRGTVVRWEKRLNAGTWVNISSSAINYSEIPSAAGTWEYRALLQNSPCSADYSSTFSVTVTTTPIGALCTCPINLNLPVVNYQGHTSAYGNNYLPADVSPNFSGLAANDAVFSFTISSRSQVSATLGVSGIWGSLLLSSNCPNAAAPSSYINTLLAWNGGTMISTLDPGTYYLIVSSSSVWTLTMPFTLNISTTAARPLERYSPAFDVAESMTIDIYPNPVLENLNVRCSELPQALRIVSPMGSVHFEQQNPSTNVFNIPVQQLSPGLYFIQIVGQNGNIQNRSFIIGNQ